MKKLLIVLLICAAFLQGGCATMLNNHKVPKNMSDTALEKADSLGLIDYRWRYAVGNIIGTLVFLPWAVSFIVDTGNLANYYVTDQETFDKWYSKVLKEQQAARQKIMEDKD